MSDISVPNLNCVVYALMHLYTVYSVSIDQDDNQLQSRIMRKTLEI